MTRRGSKIARAAWATALPFVVLATPALAQDSRADAILAEAAADCASYEAGIFDPGEAVSHP